MSGFTVEALYYSSPNGAGSLRVQQDGGSYPFLPPEWRRGRAVQYPVVYTTAAGKTRVPLRATFSGAPPSTVCTFQGVLRLDVGSNPEGPFPLGDTNPVEVLIDAAGNSPLIDFEITAGQMTRVFRGTISLEWQATIGNGTQQVGVTKNPLYVVLDTPRSPWATNGVDPLEVPWVTALDVACAWAGGASSDEEVVELIARAVNCGGRHTYSPATHFGINRFQLGNYLRALSDPRLPRIQVNCSDCAAILHTLSSLLGVESRIDKMDPNCVTRPVTLIGTAVPRVQNWAYHAFCMRGADGPAGNVDDMCLRIGGAGYPPVAMPYSGPGGYHSSLIESGCGTLRLAPPCYIAG